MGSWITQYMMANYRGRGYLSVKIRQCSATLGEIYWILDVADGLLLLMLFMLMLSLLLFVFLLAVVLVLLLFLLLLLLLLLIVCF
jgi:hypothetical protein